MPGLGRWWWSFFPFPHSSKIPPPSATHPPTQGTPMPVSVPLRNPAFPACLLLQGLSRPAWAPVKGWSEPSGVLGNGYRRMPPHIRVEAPGKRVRDQHYFLNKRGLVFLVCDFLSPFPSERVWGQGCQRFLKTQFIPLLLAGGCTRMLEEL